MADAPTRTNDRDRTNSLAVRVRAASALTSRAHRSATPTDLVLAPEQLHRRNLKRALADASQPRSSLRFTSPVDVASALLAGDRRTLDRTDRLRLVEEILADPSPDVAQLRTAFGTRLAVHAETVEAAREELDVVAGGPHARREALADVVDSLPPHAARETDALLEGLRGVSEELAERANRGVSEAAVFRAACDALESSDGAAWDAAFPDVECLSLAGVSTVGSALLDFLGHVAAFTDVGVDLFLRAGTGPRVADRLADRLAGASADRLADVDVAILDRPPGAVSPAVPTAELVASTRREEARVALSVVDALLARGVSVSDVAVVARDVDRYERPLDRAARERGRRLSVWSQLALSQTRPYRLLVACLERLAADADGVDRETLFAPLDHEWVPPDATPDGRWPLDHGAVAALRRALGDAETSRSLANWRDRLGTVAEEGDVDADAAAALRATCRWADAQPSTPGPGDVEAALGPVLEAYDEVVLPAHLAADAPDLTETSRTAWALERSRGLLEQVDRKYGDWLERGHVTRSWATVLDVVDAVATTRPGRREHDNAERVDVLDATDTWLRRYPYVVAVGLVDGEWPERPAGAFPPAFRDAVIGGDGAAGALGVRGAWTEERETDHFDDAVRAATEGLVFTRFTEDAEGVSYHRSPLLEDVDADPVVVEGADVADLLAADRRLPEALRHVLGGAPDDGEVGP